MERNIDRNGSSKPRAARILILTLPLAIVIRYGVATRYRPTGGLRTTTRDLMRQMETDLGTKLDWIAVDHHNTGHPHTHIAPPSTLSGRALPSTVSAAIPRPSFAPTSARWKRCAASVMPSGSTLGWLLPFMQDGQPKFLTKDELRVAAMRQLNVSNSSFDFAWIKAIEETGRHGWHEPLRRRRRTKS